MMREEEFGPFYSMGNAANTEEDVYALLFGLIDRQGYCEVMDTIQQICLKQAERSANSELPSMRLTREWLNAAKHAARHPNF